MTKRFLTVSAAAMAGIAATVAALPVTAAPAGDAAAGKKVFMRCAACHTVSASGPQKMGPTMAGVVNRKAGAVKDARYSPALAKSALVWNEKNLDAWLQRPSKVVPGTSMAFAGIADETQRRDLIAYLKTLK
ncbi:c-type cytochrome [Croceicoccus sp. BE223]|uniref:c-type cytochrome n=1 Tax=Croceicoccus sp. BE223 TaxID=2817716 RepID=UPI00285547D5|nr:c-type cytochrome [Croceicoccus sp. BE223]MDR7101140.1 cytochrome c [Croceicoccus sp. BE223]